VRKENQPSFTLLIPKDHQCQEVIKAFVAKHVDEGGKEPGDGSVLVCGCNKLYAMENNQWSRTQREQ